MRKKGRRTKVYEQRRKEEQESIHLYHCITGKSCPIIDFQKTFIQNLFLIKFVATHLWIRKTERVSHYLLRLAYFHLQPICGPVLNQTVTLPSSPDIGSLDIGSLTEKLMKWG